LLSCLSCINFKGIKIHTCPLTHLSLADVVLNIFFQLLFINMGRAVTVSVGNTIRTGALSRPAGSWRNLALINNW
jgi:hypothetical protein